MNHKFTLKYSITFYEDFEKIILYIQKELKNTIAANNLINEVERAIKNRLQNPLDYEQYKTRKGNVYYRIYIKNYIIFYTVTDNEIEIRRMIYHKRDIEGFVNWKIKKP